jgi:hypothetical protein
MRALFVDVVVLMLPNDKDVLPTLVNKGVDAIGRSISHGYVTTWIAQASAVLSCCCLVVQGFHHFSKHCHL